MDGYSSVPGLEEGFEYEVRGTRVMHGEEVYVLKCENTGEYSKLAVQFVDILLTDEDVPLKLK